MAEIKRFNFNDIAADLGYVAAQPAGGPGGPGGKPAGGPGGKPAGGPPNFSDPELIKKNAQRFKVMWPDERAMRLLNYFDDYV